MTIVRFPASKYRNIPIQGYDSKREFRRSQELAMLFASGKIRNWKLKPRFEVCPAVGPHRAVFYEADWSYEEAPNWNFVVEDAKGVRTDVYKLKKKLMRWRWNIEIRET
jgi:hypothetical protein